MAVRFDDSRFPIVEIAFEEPIELEDVDAFATQCRVWLAREVRHVSVFDGRALLRLGADRRQRFAQVATDLGDESKRWVICSCLVFTNPIVRGIVTAINWLSPPPVEQHMFSDREAALAYARHRLDRDAPPGP